MLWVGPSRLKRLLLLTLTPLPGPKSQSWRWMPCKCPSPAASEDHKRFTCCGTLFTYKCIGWKGMPWTSYLGCGGMAGVDAGKVSEAHQ